MIFIRLEMNRARTGQTDGFGDRRLFHMHMERIEHQPDGRMVDRVEQLERLEGGAEDVALEAVQRFHRKHDPSSARMRARQLQPGNAALLTGQPLALGDWRRRPAGEDERIAGQRAADDAGTELRRTIHRIAQVIDALLPRRGLAAR